MALFLPVFITRAAGRGIADSAIAISAISHEHFLPAMGSLFPESADIRVVDVPGLLRGVDGASGSNRRAAGRRGTLSAERVQTSVVSDGHCSELLKWLACYQRRRQLQLQAGRRAHLRFCYHSTRKKRIRAGDHCTCWRATLESRTEPFVSSTTVETLT